MLATAVGNYPKISNRPGGQKLRRAINRFDRGEVGTEELAQVEDEVTREVIREQEQAGLDVATDGMIRWDDGQTYLARQIEGFKITGLIRYFDTNTYYRQPVAAEPLRWKGPMTVRDYRFATGCTSLPIKPILTGPYTLAKLSHTEHHTGLLEFALDIAEVIRQEAKALEEAGATMLQLDEPAIVRNKEDWDLFQQVMSHLTEGLSIKRLLYTYFGDATDLPAFFQLPFHGFGLDFIWGPANFDLLPHLPSDRELGLGIVDARNVKLETVDHLSSTIERAMRHVSPDRIYLNPSCGLDYLPRETAFAKLRRMVEGMNAVKEAVG
ncbi:MAG: methylcobamide--CoM methyltransferase [Dehalococcoidia bacterium]